MYFRRRFSSFEEFQRESVDLGGAELGKEEMELIEALEDHDNFDRHRRSRRSPWD